MEATMETLDDVMPYVLADVRSAACPCTDATVTEWVLVARRADGIRVYGSDNGHSPGLLTDALDTCRQV